MAYKITDDCISCGACERECLNEAISEGESIFETDPNKCTECVGFYESSRCAKVCPVDACIPDPDHAETRDHLLAKFKRLNPGKTPVLF